MRTTAKQSECIVRDTRKYIIDVARQFFSEYSYLGVSMSDIAEKLNITKAALYYHFTGKAEIYEKVINEVFYDLSLTINEATKGTTINKKLHKLIKNYLDFGYKEKNFIKAVILESSPSDNLVTKHIAELREQITNSIQPLMKEILVSKNLTNKVNSRFLASALTSMMDGLLLEYSFLNKKIDSTKMANQIMAVLF